MGNERAQHEAERGAGAHRLGRNDVSHRSADRLVHKVEQRHTRDARAQQHDEPPRGEQHEDVHGVEERPGEVEADACPPRALLRDAAVGGVAIKRLSPPHDIEFVYRRKDGRCMGSGGE